jgi:hydroxymethylbilane synthase
MVTLRVAADDAPHEPLARLSEQGFFVKEIEEALLRHECDIAVHSLKDLPGAQPAELRIAAVTERLSPFDAFISREGEELFDLEPGARVGTSSPRRTAQLLHLKPDLRIVPLRGNVDTRLAKLRRGDYDAIVLATAGLHRAGLKGFITHELTPPSFLPAPGQGCLALETRSTDEEAVRLASVLNHTPSERCVAAERTLHTSLGAGCHAPVGAYAHLPTEDRIVLQGSVFSADGTKIIAGTRDAHAGQAVECGTVLARELLERGAAELLACR